jgi:hypothetical protein
LYSVYLSVFSSVLSSDSIQKEDFCSLENLEKKELVEEEEEDEGGLVEAAASRLNSLGGLNSLLKATELLGSMSRLPKRGNLPTVMFSMYKGTEGVGECLLTSCLRPCQYEGPNYTVCLSARHNNPIITDRTH